MEIKVPTEIDYKEGIFFGLAAREFICCVAAILAAVCLHFLLKWLGVPSDTVGWVCILGAVPPAAAGFFKYNGMNLEQFLLAFFKTMVLYSGRRLYVSENYLYEIVMAPDVPERKMADGEKEE